MFLKKYGVECSNTCTVNMGSKQYGVDHLNMEVNKFTVERKVYHLLNQSQFRISILVFLQGKLYRILANHRQVQSKFTLNEKHMTRKG